MTCHGLWQYPHEVSWVHFAADLQKQYAMVQCRLKRAYSGNAGGCGHNILWARRRATPNELQTVDVGTAREMQD